MMASEKEFAAWLVSVDWDHSRNTYVQLYADAPEWIYEHAVGVFGTGTVLLRSDLTRPQVV